jgi:hypothetical protein
MPDGTLPCTTNTLRNDPISECTCIEIPYGVYYVDINAILDVETYQQTVAYCGQTGENCPNKNQAPVCNTINSNHLFPGADLISTFSFACTGLPELDRQRALHESLQGIYAMHAG